jgi:hypothetical protein
LGFLARGQFGSKSPDRSRWIILDFLGFSRPNLDFSMGYTDKARIFISGVALGAPEWGLATQKRRMVIGKV